MFGKLLGKMLEVLRGEGGEQQWCGALGSPSGDAGVPRAQGRLASFSKQVPPCFRTSVPTPHVGPGCESALTYAFPWVSLRREKAEAGGASPKVSQEPGVLEALPW